MIRLEDRQAIAQAVEQAQQAGARLRPACELAGIDVRTLQRWKAGDGLVRGDRRPDAVREPPAHALSEVERARLLQVANEPRFADVPPARIVPMLADEGVYLEPNDITGRQLAAKLGVSPSTLNWVLQGTSGISPEMALRLSRALGRSPESWLSILDNHDLWQARQTVDLNAVERIDFRAA